MSQPWEDFGPWNDFEEKPDSNVATAQPLEVPKTLGEIMPSWEQQRAAIPTVTAQATLPTNFGLYVPPVEKSREQQVMEQTWAGLSPTDKLASDLSRLGREAIEGVGATVKGFGIKEALSRGMLDDPNAMMTPWHLEQLQERMTQTPEQRRQEIELSPAVQLGERISAFGERQFPTVQPESVNRPLGAVAGGVGSTVSFLPAGVAGPGALATVGALQAGAVGYQEAIDKGANLDDATASFIINALGGTTEAIPIARVFERINKASGGSVGRALKDMIASGFEEGAQETFQSVLGNVAAKHLYDEERDILENVAGSAGTGTAVGFLLSGLGIGVGATARRVTRPQQPQTRKETPDAVQQEAASVLPPVLEPEITQEGPIQVPERARSQETAEALTAIDIGKMSPSQFVEYVKGKDQLAEQRRIAQAESTETLRAITAQSLAETEAAQKAVDMAKPETLQAYASAAAKMQFFNEALREKSALEKKGVEPSEETKRQEEVSMTPPAQAVSETPPAVGDFPRVSETLGLGESSLPPTVETVRQQRALDERNAVPPAPGEKTTPSRGQWFGGNNPRETADMMQSRSDAFLRGKTDEQSIVDLARAAGGDPNVQLDNQAANFAIKDLLVRIHAKLQSAKANPVYQQQGWAQIDRLAELSRRLGAEDARSLVSRQLAYRQIDWMMPLLSWRGIVQDKWRQALGLEPNAPVEGLDTPENAARFNLPRINGPEAQKLAELVRRAQSESPGVKRNKTMEEMVRILQSDSRISKLDLLRDVWYASVLMRAGTMLNVLAGSYATGASFAGLAALDRFVRLHPIQAFKILGQFIGGTIEGTVIADQIARKGAYHLLPDAEQRMTNLLTGKSGARFDNLEQLLRRGNPLGLLAYTRRFMAALDYIGALGTRNSQVLYAALTRNDQESLDALDRKSDKAINQQAEQQARSEMGPKASKAEVLIRKREILEQNVSQQIKDAAVQTARRAAQNADPRGIPGWIYRMSAKIPFLARAPLGLAFMRSAMNMVQNASDYTPGIGAQAALRGEIEARLPKSNPLRKAGIGLNIPIEERRMMWTAQAASLGIGAIAAGLFLGDDDDKDGMEISGSWLGLSQKQRNQLMELGERPNSIRFGKNGPWINFKQMPFAPPLSMVGSMRDQQRFNAKEWNGESAMSKLVAGWLAGLLYVRDISSLSGLAALFDMNAWNTQESPTKLTAKANKFASQSAGRFATGYIPSILKEVDEFFDPTLYRPSKDELAGYWIKNIPYARKTVGPGPALNNFGEPIQVTPPPIKSWVGFGKDNDLYNTLGALVSRGIFLPEPGKTAKIVDDDAVYREMTEDEWYKFIKERGPLLKDHFTEGRLAWLRDSSDEQVIKWLSDTSEKVSAQARTRLFPLTRIERLRREPIK